jgi:hypothetical protein
MWIKLSGALLAAMSMINLADAGLLGSLRGGCGAEKGCGCASTCQPACCKPVIVKPCCPNVYTYQRKCSDIKPPCCDTCCPPATCCAPAANACAPAAAPAACAPACAAPAACAPAAAPACAAPAACAPAAAPACAAPAACAPACAAPAACAPAAAPACAAPCAPAATACTPACAPACCNTKKGGLLSGLFSSKKLNCGSCNTCAAPDNTCAAPCETRCCNADPCEIAKLIYESQTACYAKDRRAAIRKIGNKFDCICNPEIMTALIVGLNDCDERVRREAADEIGDQIKKNCCCCPQVVAALTCALGDCDKHVVKQATEALERCGYEVVDGCCNPCGAAQACGTNGCAPAPAAAPAPVPPCSTGARSIGLQNLLGMLD